MRKEPCKVIYNDDLQYYINEQAQLLDVRSKREFEKGHIKGFMNINYYHLLRDKTLVDDLQKDKETVVICETGDRSEGACKILRQYGFKEVYNHRYGLVNWKDELVK